MFGIDALIMNSKFSTLGHILSTRKTQLQMVGENKIKMKPGDINKRFHVFSLHIIQTYLEKESGEVA